MDSFQIVIRLDQAADNRPTRRRRQHTRSRTGCLTCKQRRVRCDEQQPKCTNCIIGSRECKYAAVSLPLRERRSLGAEVVPGVQTPWQIARQPRNSAIDDPFDCLPIEMPLKSRELFHYFAHNREFVSAKDSFMPGDPKRDCLAIAIQEPSAFRSALLIAGLHYSWQKGGFKEFESTYLFHKGECIRAVNDWVRDFNTRATANCMQLISTLVLAESFSGDVPTAEAHCDGLMTVLDLKEAENGRTLVGQDDDNEVLERYILLAHNFVCGVKGLQHQANLPNAPLLGQWRGLATTGRDARLKSLRVIPYFFGSLDALDDLKPKGRPINAEPTFKILRDMTAKAAGGSLAAVWTSNGPSQLLLEYSKSHVLSLSPAEREADSNAQHGKEAQSSWCGLATATEFYLQSVLGMWYGGDTIEPRLLRRLFLILKRDITKSEDDVITGQTSRELWFWKVFVGAYATAKALSRSEYLDQPQHGNTLQVFRFWFDGKIRVWAEVAGVETWDKAKEVLATMAWPKYSSFDDSLERSVWKNALAASYQETPLYEI